MPFDIFQQAEAKAANLPIGQSEFSPEKIAVASAIKNTPINSTKAPTILDDISSGVSNFKKDALDFASNAINSMGSVVGHNPNVDLNSWNEKGTQLQEQTKQKFSENKITDAFQRFGENPLKQINQALIFSNNQSERDLNSARQDALGVANPSDNGLIKTLIGGDKNSALTQEDIKNYGDNIQKAVGSNYSVRLTQDGNGRLVPYIKPTTDQSENWQELHSDNFLKNMYNEIAAHPIENIAMLMPFGGALKTGEVLGGTLGRIAAAGVATGVGGAGGAALDMANQEAFNGATYSPKNYLNKIENNLLDYGALGSAGEAIFPIVPNVISAIKDAPTFITNRAFRGNVDAAKKTMSMQNFTPEEIARHDYLIDRFDNQIDSPNFINEMPKMFKDGSSLQKSAENTANLIDKVGGAEEAEQIRRRLLSVAGHKDSKIVAEVTDAMDKNANQARLYSDEIENRSDTLNEQFSKATKTPDGKNFDIYTILNDTIKQNDGNVKNSYANVKNIWQQAFPEEIATNDVVRLNTNIEDLKASIVPEDIKGSQLVAGLENALNNGKTIGDIFDARVAIGGLLNKNGISYDTKGALLEAKNNIDDFLKQVSDVALPQDGNLYSATKKSLEDYSNVLAFHNSDIYKIATKDYTNSDELIKQIQKAYESQNEEALRPLKNVISPAMLENIENRVLGNIVKDATNTQGKRYTDFAKVHSKLTDTLKNNLTTDSAKANFQDLKDLAEYRYYDKTFQEAALNAKNREAGTGIGTKVWGMMERILAVRIFKYLYKQFPTELARGMATRDQLAAAFKYKTGLNDFIISGVEKSSKSPISGKEYSAGIADIIRSSMSEERGVFFDALKNLNELDGVPNGYKLAEQKKILDAYKQLVNSNILADLAVKAHEKRRKEAFVAMAQNGADVGAIAKKLGLNIKSEDSAEIGAINDALKTPDSAIQKLLPYMPSEYKSVVNNQDIYTATQDGLIITPQAQILKQNSNHETAESRLDEYIPDTYKPQANQDTATQTTDSLLMGNIANKMQDIQTELKYYDDSKPNFVPLEATQENIKNFYSKNLFLNKLKELSSSFFITFQGAKKDMALYVPQYLKEEMPYQQRAQITTINEYFGGGGTWGSMIASAPNLLPNVKNINIYEYNKYRALKIQALINDAEGLASTLADPRFKSFIHSLYQIGKEEGLESSRFWLASTLADPRFKSFIHSLYQIGKEEGLESSRFWLASKINFLFANKNELNMLDEVFNKPIEKAAMYLFADYGNASFGKKDNLDATLKMLSNKVRSIGENYNKLKDRGVKFNINVGVDSFNITPEQGSHVMAIVDPPYYMTKGYDIITNDGKMLKGEIEGIETYQKTQNLLTNLSNAKNAIVYTDEAWEVEKLAKTINEKPNFARTTIDGISDKEIRDNIKKAMTNYFVLPYKVANRYEVIGLKFEKGVVNDAARNVHGRADADGNNAFNERWANAERSEYSNNDRYENLERKAKQNSTTTFASDGVQARELNDALELNKKIYEQQSQKVKPEYIATAFPDSQVAQLLKNNTKTDAPEFLEAYAKEFNNFNALPKNEQIEYIKQSNNTSDTKLPTKEEFNELDQAIVLDKIDSNNPSKSPYYSEFGITKADVARIEKKLSSSEQLSEKEALALQNMQKYADESGALERYRQARQEHELSQEKSEFIPSTLTYSDESQFDGFINIKDLTPQELNKQLIELGEIFPQKTSSLASYNKELISDYAKPLANALASFEPRSKDVVDKLIGKVSKGDDAANKELLSYKKQEQDAKLELDELIAEIEPKIADYEARYKNKSNTTLNTQFLKANDTLDKTFGDIKQELVNADFGELRQDAIDALAKMAAINKINPNISVHGGGAILGGVVNGISFDEDGNLQIEPDKFALGLAASAVGTAYAPALLRAIKDGKAGKDAVVLFTKQLEKIKELAIDGGNAIAMQALKKFEDSHYNLMPQIFGDNNIKSMIGVPQELEKFGRNFAQFKNKPDDAISFLMQQKNGQVRDAIYKDGIGGIDFIYGKTWEKKGKTQGYGLAKIEAKHGIDIIKQIPEIIKNSEITKQTPAHIELTDKNKMAVVYLDYAGKEKTWLMTAFEMPNPQILTDEGSHVGTSGNLAPKATSSIAQTTPKSQDLNAVAAIGGGAGVDSQNDEQTPYGTIAGVGAAIAFGKKGGFFSKLEQTIIDKLPNKFGESALKAVLKNNGVKEDEIRFSGLNSGLDTLKDSKGNIGKSEILEYLQNSGVKLKKEEFSGDDLTEYSAHITQAPETSNYREILTSVDVPEKIYKSNHWSEPNVLYHTRVQDANIDGQKTLLVDEMQSDWHQDGRRLGYKNSEILKEVDAKKLELVDRQINGENVPDSEWQILRDKLNTARNGVPEAPYAKTWHEKAMKDVIDDAVQNGYERVAWTVGETQNKRYDLSKFADEIAYNSNSKILQAKKDGQEIMWRSNVAENDLQGIIGKEATNRLLASEANKGGGRKIAGEELKIGGDGMTGFYDKILPDFVRGYIKKYGSTLEQKTLSNDEKVWSFEVTPKMKELIKEHGQALYSVPIVGAGVAISQKQDN